MKILGSDSNGFTGLNLFGRLSKDTLNEIIEKIEPGIKNNLDLINRQEEFK